MNKTRLLAYLAIGNLFGALLWNPPSQAWDLASWVTDSVNGIGRAITTSPGQAQSPLPVPQAQPPIGNSASIQPCAAPPPLAIKKMPTSMPKPSKPVASIEPTQPAQFVPPSSERIAYNQAGSITQAQADRMSRFSKPQSRKAMISLLGAPNWFDTHSDVYEIQGTSDGIVAPRRLIVTYELDPDSNFTIAHATDWIQQ